MVRQALMEVLDAVLQEGTVFVGEQVVEAFVAEDVAGADG